MAAPRALSHRRQRSSRALLDGAPTGSITQRFDETRVTRTTEAAVTRDTDVTRDQGGRDDPRDIRARRTLLVPGIVRPPHPPDAPSAGRAIWACAVFAIDDGERRPSGGRRYKELPRCAFVQRLLTALLVVGATACGTTATPSPPTSPAPSVATSPATESRSSSPARGTVLDVLSRLADPSLTLSAVISGTLQIGPMSAPVTGTLEVAPGATHSEITVALPSESQSTEQIVVDGHSYKRSSLTAPWFEEAPSAAGKDLGQTLATIGSITDKGPSKRDGRSVHHFATIPGAIPASAFGFDNPGISGFSGSFDLYADDSGKLVGISLGAHWQQPDAQDVLTPGSMALDFDLSDSQPVIAAPTDLWTLFTSVRWNYTIGHPVAVTTIEGKTAADPDVFGASKDEFYVVVREQQPAGVKLADYVASYVAATQKQTKVKPDSMAEVGIDGRPGTVLFHHLPIQGKDRYNVVLLTLDGRYGYTIALVGLPGQEANVNSFADRLRSTFRIVK